MTENKEIGLKRTLGFWALASYGLGDILGAGIYALMGKVAGAAGAHAWLGFSVSLLVAAVTLALSGTLNYLAGSTSTLLLVVFLTVNLALVMIKRRDTGETANGFRVPVAVPLLGIAITAVVIGFAETSVLMTTGALIAAGAGLWGIRHFSS